MTLAQSILAALLSLPVSKYDADELDRASRLETKAAGYADTVERATCTGEHHVYGCLPIYRDPVELAAAIVVQDYSESGLRRDVELGVCRPGECDSETIKGVMFFRALGSFQIHRNGMPLDVWHNMAGLSLDNVKASSWWFASHFAGGVGRCHALAGGFAVMSGGHACTSPRAEMRARKTRVFKVRIAQLMRESEK